jgi:hypothetical protein
MSNSHGLQVKILANSLLCFRLKAPESSRLFAFWLPGRVAQACDL